MNGMNSKKKLIAIFVALLVSLNVSFAALYFLVLAPNKTPAEPAIEEPETVEAAAPSNELSDEYYSIHFSFNDAIHLCSNEARSRNSNLIQLSLNEHSSRFKPEENIYLIKLDSHVGTPLLYDEKAHTCEIDPKTQGVAFYREITRRKAVRPQ